MTPAPTTSEPTATRPPEITKIAVALRDDLETWQKINVTAFLTSGLGAADPAVLGRRYRDGDGVVYTAMLAHPVRVFAADVAALRRAFDRARNRNLLIGVYTMDLFATMCDADNRAAVAAVPTAALDLAGFVAVGDGRQVDKAFDRLRLHR